MTPTDQITLEDIKAMKNTLEAANVPHPYFIWAAFPLCLTFIFLGYTPIGDDLYAFPEQIETY